MLHVSVCIPSLETIQGLHFQRSPQLPQIHRRYRSVGAMAAKQRLQELFAKYDTSGDGVLSEEEMTAAPGMKPPENFRKKTVALIIGYHWYLLLVAVSLENSPL